MQLQLIDYKTAQLAKEQGFDVPCSSFYNPHGDLRNSYVAGYDYTAHEDNVLCPHQNLLQKWIRVKHNISVEPNVNDEGWDADIYSTDGKTINEGGIRKKKTYEDALEAGLRWALEYINYEKQKA